MNAKLSRTLSHGPPRRDPRDRARFMTKSDDAMSRTYYAGLTSS